MTRATRSAWPRPPAASSRSTPPSRSWSSRSAPATGWLAARSCDYPRPRPACRAWAAGFRPTSRRWPRAARPGHPLPGADHRRRGGTAPRARHRGARAPHRPAGRRLPRCAAAGCGRAGAADSLALGRGGARAPCTGRDRAPPLRTRPRIPAAAPRLGPAADRARRRQLRERAGRARRRRATSSTTSPRPPRRCPSRRLRPGRRSSCPRRLAIAGPRPPARVADPVARFEKAASSGSPNPSPTAPVLARPGRPRLTGAAGVHHSHTLGAPMSRFPRATARAGVAAASPRHRSSAQEPRDTTRSPRSSSPPPGIPSRRTRSPPP